MVGVCKDAAGCGARRTGNATVVGRGREGLAKGHQSLGSDDGQGRGVEGGVGNRCRVAAGNGAGSRGTQLVCRWSLTPRWAS